MNGKPDPPAMTTTHPNLMAWGIDPPSEPGRLPVDDPDVQRLAADISRGSRLTDLGGTMSLNARLDPAGVVLRVHQYFVSRQRLLAVQEVRRRLASQGLLVPLPVRWKGATVFRCRNRWAELDEYLPHEQPEPSLCSYSWMFGAMGYLHRALAALDLSVPRPLIATYAPPGTLRRWLPVTEAAVQGDPQAREIARLVRDLVGRLRRQWLPATGLPMQLVHGDVRLTNVCRAPEGKPVYLDFGFLAWRPRIHELAYSLAYMVLARDADPTPERLAGQNVMPLIEAYEAAGKSTLTATERRALAPYIAAVPLYHAANAGFRDDPVNQLRTSLPFLRLSEWLLAHPTALLGRVS
jgi:Ser/Thr protein kinase RdoA (MazF antagonist)